jgi:DnaJ-class molecular chaperone
MHYLEAIAVLRLSLAESLDELRIRRSWKQMVKKTHPDKNISGNSNATLKTQQLNEAKDILISRMTDHSDKKRREDEEERLAKLAETEAKQAAEEKKRREVEEEILAKLAETEAKQAAEREMILKSRRKSCKKTRGKRLPSARIHRKSSDYREGRDLVNEMKNFFRDNFMLEASNQLEVSDIQVLFMRSRHSTTDLEINLFKRHSKRIFIETWPTSIYSRKKFKRCFLHVSAK